MNRILAAIVLVVLGASISLASADPPAKATVSPGNAPEGAGDRKVLNTDARAILQLEEEFAVGLVRRDVETFRRLLAEGFVYSEDDRTMDRDTVLRDLMAGPDTVDVAKNEGMRVHLFGPTAAVTGWLNVRGHIASAAFERRYRFTDTWARLDGRWQLVAAHDYLVPAGRR